MTKDELLDMTAWTSGASVDETERVLDNLVRELRVAIRAGQAVEVPGLGIFTGARFIPEPGPVAVGG